MLPNIHYSYVEEEYNILIIDPDIRIIEIRILDIMFHKFRNT